MDEAERVGLCVCVCVCVWEGGLGGEEGREGGPQSRKTAVSRV